MLMMLNYVDTSPAKRIIYLFKEPLIDSKTGVTHGY